MAQAPGIAVKVPECVDVLAFRAPSGRAAQNTALSRSGLYRGLSRSERRPVDPFS